MEITEITQEVILPHHQTKENGQYSISMSLILGTDYTMCGAQCKMKIAGLLVQNVLRI